MANQLNSRRLVIDASTGVVVQRREYDEWGQVTADSAPGFIPFCFAAGLYDEDTALVRFGARDDDPDAGRWLAKDPLLFKGPAANIYGYALGDPINSADPGGRRVTWDDDRTTSALEALAADPATAESFAHIASHDKFQVFVTPAPDNQEMIDLGGGSITEHADDPSVMYVNYTSDDLTNNPDPGMQTCSERWARKAVFHEMVHACARFQFLYGNSVVGPALQQLGSFEAFTNMTAVYFENAAGAGPWRASH